MPHENIREQNIKTVIEKAGELIAKNGVEHTTIDKIALASHLTSRSVLKYFSNKDELVYSVLNEIIKRELNGFKKYSSSEEFNKLNGLDQAKEIIRFFLDSCICSNESVYVATRIYQSINIYKDGCPYFVDMDLMSLIKEKLTNAMIKGSKDGTISEDFFKDDDRVNALLICLRGTQQQLAIGYHNHIKEGIFNVSNIINSYVELMSYLLQRK